MDRWDAGDGEGGDPFAGATGSVVVPLFEHDGNTRGGTTRGGQRRALNFRVCCAPLFFIVHLSIVDVEEVDIKEGKEDKDEKKTLLKL